MATIEQLARKIIELEQKLDVALNKTGQLQRESEKALDTALHVYKLDAYGYLWVYDADTQQYHQTKMRVMTPEIAGQAIKAIHIADGAVTSAKIDNEAVTTDKIAPGAVTTSKLVDESITGDELEDDVVKKGKIATDAVQTRNIKDQNVTNEKIKDHDLSWDKLDHDLQTRITTHEYGPSLSVDFGNSDDVGITQKTLSEAIGNVHKAGDNFVSLQYQIDQIVSGGATLNLYASPTVVFVGVQRSISVTATSDTGASSIKIFKNGIENPISSGSDRMLPAIDTVTPSTRGNIQYYAEFVISGLTKRYPESENDFVNVQAVDEIYTGAGATYGDTTMVEETSPHAAGSFNKQITTADGDYLFIEVPDNFNLTSIKLVSTYETSLGFTQIESTRAGYKAYKNNDARGAGTYTYKFTIANA